MNKILPIILVVVLSGCSSENWRCVTENEAMYSLNDTGELGSADKGCSCAEIRDWEMKVFGKVDERALREDFGC